MVEKQHKVWFSKALLKWNNQVNDRQMPWKGIQDPYKIWLSEIILQQTRVEQGLEYYNRFIKRFPTVHDLAQTKDNEVFKMWEGLGYYTRCRNLIKTAKEISLERGGLFPQSLEGLLSLKGVGGYTAAAIGSFAFGLPLAVVDGNVIRVLTRVFGIADPIDQANGKKKLELLAGELIDKLNPASYNQAIMDFGATVCKPKNPICENCPLQKQCYAFQHDAQANFPIKAKKKKPIERFFYYLLLEHQGSQMVRKRTEDGIWKDLFEFILRETDEPVEEKELTKLSFWGIKHRLTRKDHIELSGPLVHQLTHQRIHCRILHVQLDDKINHPSHVWKSPSQLKKLAFPRLITRYLNQD